MTAWANRKAAVRAEAETLAKDEQAAVLAEQHAALAEQSEQDVLDELDLPNPDDMQAGDDFSAFMKSTVPAALRNRALRKLWTSDPILANVDLLVDYGEDFTGKNDPVGVIKTIYRVGKGMLPDQEDHPEIVEDVSKPKELVTKSEQETELETTDHDALPDVATAPEAVAKVTPEQDQPEPPAPRRRMRFEFSPLNRPLNQSVNQSAYQPGTTETETA
ncbi:MAG: DUF3306 domain-containing protein [Rhodobacteraceae bacterium]|nr:DUF3306 domain-containing protein [Paracoccaceae bacterium]